MSDTRTRFVRPTAAQVEELHWLISLPSVRVFSPVVAGSLVRRGWAVPTGATTDWPLRVTIEGIAAFFRAGHSLRGYSICADHAARIEAAAYAENDARRADAVLARAAVAFVARHAQRDTREPLSIVIVTGDDGATPTAHDQLCGAYDASNTLAQDDGIYRMKHLATLAASHGVDPETLAFHDCLG